VLVVRERVLEYGKADDYEPPGCLNGCFPNVNYELGAAEGLVAVACPEEPPCWPGWTMVTRTEVEGPALPRERRLRQDRRDPPPVAAAEARAQAVSRRGNDAPARDEHRRRVAARAQARVRADLPRPARRPRGR